VCYKNTAQAFNPIFIARWIYAEEGYSLRIYIFRTGGLRMKESRLDAIKKEFFDIYIAIRDLTDDDVLNGPQGRFRQDFERLQRLIAREDRQK
jgi:hypothetical protein